VFPIRQLRLLRVSLGVLEIRLARSHDQIRTGHFDSYVMPALATQLFRSKPEHIAAAQETTTISTFERNGVLSCESDAVRERRLRESHSEVHGTSFVIVSCPGARSKATEAQS
jgi:hypothetical protein